MPVEEYLYFSRRAKQEHEAARHARNLAASAIHRELEAAYRSRCESLCASEPAVRYAVSGRDPSGGGLIMVPIKAHRTGPMTFDYQELP